MNQKNLALRWAVFIIGTLITYSAVGIILGIVVAWIPMWFAPDTMADAFGGKVWHDQQNLKPAYVGSVLLGVGAFSGFLLGASLCIVHLAIALIVSGSRKK